MALHILLCNVVRGLWIRAFRVFSGAFSTGFSASAVDPFVDRQFSVGVSLYFVRFKSESSDVRLA